MAGLTTLERTQEIVQHKQTQGLQFLAKAHESLAASVRRSRAHMLGRDDNGKVVDTCTPASLDIVVKGWFVQTTFKKDDLDALDGIDWRDVEVMIKQHTVPQKPVSDSEGHIISATRQLKDIRQKYERSLGKGDGEGVKADADKNDPQVVAFYQLNIEMSDKRNTISVQDVWTHIKTLEGFRPLFENKKTALGRFVGLGRLDEAIRKFRRAAHVQPDERSFAITSACAVFNSVNERQTTWKKKHDAEMAARTFGRECALRVERDRWLLAQFSKFASNPKQARQFAKMDAEKKDIMELLRQKIETACKLGTELTHLKSKKNPSAEHLQLIQDKEAELKKAVLHANGYFHANEEVCTENGRKPPFILAHHKWIDRYLLKHDFEKALAKLDYFVLLLDSNKPRFILNELSDKPDPYLDKVVLPALKLAVEAMEAEDFKTARDHFRDVVIAMREIVYPQADKNENKNGLPLTEHIQKGGSCPDY
jgi:hypothetical protein